MTSSQQSTMRRVLDAVCRVGGIDETALYSRRRTQTLADMRHAAMWGLREYCALTHAEIGMVFGRDHTTVIHGVRRINERDGDAVLPCVIRECVHAIREEMVSGQGT